MALLSVLVWGQGRPATQKTWAAVRAHMSHPPKL